RVRPGLERGGQVGGVALAVLFRDRGVPLQLVGGRRGRGVAGAVALGQFRVRRRAAVLGRAGRGLAAERPLLLGRLERIGLDAHLEGPGTQFRDAVRAVFLDLAGRGAAAVRALEDHVAAL